VLLWAGCGSTKITDRKVLVSNDRLPRPNHIWVYDFAATAAAVPADSTLAREFIVEATPQTAEQIATGQRWGARIAGDLVQRIQAMGLPAARATEDEIIGVHDLVIRGYLVSMKEGSAAKRIGVGLGAGSSELRTVVEGLQMTPHGLRQLATGTVQSGGGKGPGAAVGAAAYLATANPAGLIVSSGMKVYGEASGRSTVEGRAEATAREIAAAIKKRFQEQGWIAG